MLIPSFRAVGQNMSSVCLKGIDNTSEGTPGISDMLNLSCAAYPYIRTRYPRYAVADGAGFTAVSAAGKLCFIRNDRLYYDGQQVGILSSGISERTIVGLNDKVMVFPDKVYYDISANTFGNLEACVNIDLSGAVFRSGSSQSAGINTIYSDGVIWVLYGLRAGDCVEIRHKASGAVHDIGMYATVKTIYGDQMIFGDNCFDGIENHIITSIARKIPDMDFISECGNRLWGCAGHTVMCSAEGDPFNWYDAGRCWSAEVGKGGKFTGCAGFDGTPVFFMEDMIWKIYGSKPVNFAPMPINSVRGVKNRCDRTIAEAGGKLYYLSRDGVMCFGGGAPVNISGKLGDIGLSEGVAVSDGRRYWLSAKRGDDRILYVYDTDTGLWSCEDCPELFGAVCFEGVLYAVCGSGMITLGHTGEPDAEWRKEAMFSSYLVVSDICPDIRDNQILTSVKLRVECSEDAAIDTYIAYDGGEYVKAGQVWSRLSADSESISGSGNYTVSIPVRTCDSFSLRFAGNGEYVIKNVAFVYRKTER